ncbi:hypothetical protein OK016_15010 [Vibrio chagasii]|nr:hypothetical protein [Vibrio chagasii]
MKSGMNVYSLDMTYVGANDLESSNFFHFQTVRNPFLHQLYCGTAD